MSSTASSANPPSAFERFMAACERGLLEGRFDKLLLAGYHGPQADLKRLSVRAIELRGQPHLSFVFSHAQRDITKNHKVAEGLQELRGLIGPAFANAHLHTHDEELQLVFSRKGRCSLRVAPRVSRAGSAGVDNGVGTCLPDASIEAPATGAHNRTKHHLLSLERPFLRELGVTDAQHRLVPAMARKWKQINKFLEVFDAALAASPLLSKPAFEVLDFGSGKGYLSFALHDHLRHSRALQATVRGVELRANMVQLCNDAARRLGLKGLYFEQGDVASMPAQPVDVMIALHACDTATDHAIHFGIRGGAAIICCAPCCHKQLRPQLLSPYPLRPILQHGVHLGQEAEMLTDGLRALLLDACGYTTQVFEFVSLEHTAKNKMILAVRREQAVDAAEVLAQVQEIKAFYGIREQCLETLLKADKLL